MELIQAYYVLVPVLGSRDFSQGAGKNNYGEPEPINLIKPEPVK